MKTALTLLLFFVCINSGVFAQDMDYCESIAEVQTFDLMDNQISFRSDQMDLNSIEIILCGETDAEIIAPKSTISADDSSILIDFEGCTNGMYIITGTRDGERLTYGVELNDTH